MPHAAAAAAADGPMRVVVTGAGGQTGGHVFRKMLARPTAFSPMGIVRSEASRDALVAASGCSADQVAVLDVASVPGLYMDVAIAAFAGAAALVICTSAKVKPTGGVNPDTGRPNLGFPDGQPYNVDWLGQRRQIDGARAGNLKHVVLCGSMGGTDPAHMLNNFGKVADGRGGGNILLWKRKAEKYLTESGLKYTIVHPGGLLNEPGGRRRLRVGVDDSLIAGEHRSIPREDVAEVLVQSLLHDEYANRSFDLVAEPEAAGPVDTDFASLLSPLEGASCDYSLGAIPDEAADIAEADVLMSAL
uniref:NAD(P)-binding domain-containing protein n=1 Tax=Zooxanthella nutricula TaxID=1333877 RepID=A0A6U6NK62_9DINO